MRLGFLFLPLASLAAASRGKGRPRRPTHSLLQLSRFAQTTSADELSSEAHSSALSPQLAEGQQWQGPASIGTGVQQQQLLPLLQQQRLVSQPLPQQQVQPQVQPQQQQPQRQSQQEQPEQSPQQLPQLQSQLQQQLQLQQLPQQQPQPQSEQHQPPSAVQLAQAADSTKQLTNDTKKQARFSEDLVSQYTALHDLAQQTASLVARQQYAVQLAQQQQQQQQYFEASALAQWPPQAPYMEAAGAYAQVPQMGMAVPQAYGQMMPTQFVQAVPQGVPMQAGYGVPQLVQVAR